MRTGTRTLLTAGLCGGLLIAAVGIIAPGATGAPSKTNSGYADQTLTWGACAFKKVSRAPKSECAQVSVPRDWAKPGAGADLQVTISRVRASGERAGVLLINPGGPGGQGTSLAQIIAGIEPDLAERYDVIGMDPRGTGREGSVKPADQGVVCRVPSGRLTEKTDLDARDRSPESIAAHQQDPRAIAEACQSNALAPFITTWQTAHDMDLIRDLLGESSLNYLGYSYGSWLGAKYASLFPKRAGKMVLDSSVNWEGRLQAAFEDFPRINQRHFEQMFLPWLTRQYPKTIGDDVAEAKRTYEETRRYVAGQGLSPDGFDAQFVGLGNAISWELSGATFNKLVAEMRGIEAPEATSDDVQARSSRLVKEAYGVELRDLTAADVAPEPVPDYLDVPATRWAVACGDQATRTTEEYQRLSEQQGRQYPLDGWASGLGEVCGPWTDSPRQDLPTLPAEVADQVLVVQGEFDPQTGYEQADAAVRAAPPGTGRVLVNDSPFHGQYGLEDNPCVDGAVNVFLLKNSRPTTTTCPGTPLPGETRVYPVDGPVDAAFPNARLATSPRDTTGPSALREALSTRIVEVNSHGIR